jgi:hypothetical protein
VHALLCVCSSDLLLVDAFSTYLGHRLWSRKQNGPGLRQIHFSSPNRFTFHFGHFQLPEPLRLFIIGTVTHKLKISIRSRLISYSAGLIDYIRWTDDQKAIEFDRATTVRTWPYPAQRRRHHPSKWKGLNFVAPVARLTQRITGSLR